MLCYVMLCYVMLCYVMLCYVMLCHVMLSTLFLAVFLDISPHGRAARELQSGEHGSYFSTWYPVLPRMLLTRCMNVFVKDLFMFYFVSF